MRNNWSSTDIIGKIYKTKKMGFVLCAKHTGDNLYSYIPLRIKLDMNKFVITPLWEKQFSEYGGGGEETLVELSDKQYHLLMAGESIKGESICLN